MNKTWLTVIARAITSEQEIFPLNQTWQSIHHEYNIGLTQARKLRLTSADKQELRELVKKITGIDLELVEPGEFNAMQREQVLTLAIDEKLAGQSVKKNRLALKPLPCQDAPVKRCTLSAAGQQPLRYGPRQHRQRRASEHLDR